MLDGLVTAIVRPLRAQYSYLELGPPRLRYGDVEYQRNDFITTNSRGLQIQGSLWSIISSDLFNTDSCIIYLHPNSGSRIDVMKNSRIMSIAAHIKANVCSFDFGGCGDSEGDCISLGVREKEDVCAVMSHLLSQGCRRFILWGRSMGAATAVMFYGAYRELLVGTVIALILDSPFTSLNGLATQFTLTRSVPGLILAPALQYIRHSIQSLHGFDIMQAAPGAAAQRINIPTIVLTGSEDKTVPPVLSEELYRALVGPKMRIFFVGSHNSKRPTAVFEAVKYFLTGAMKGLSIPELLDSSVEFMRKDIIPDTVGIHGVAHTADSQVAVAEAATATERLMEDAPTEETILEAKDVPTLHRISPRVSHGKKKLHRLPSAASPDKEPTGSHHPPWNSKWEMTREHHNYGNHTTQSHHIHGIRRSTSAAIHSHVHPPRVGHPEHKQQVQRKPPRPCIHSVTVDNGNGAPKQFPVPSEESDSSTLLGGGWIGAIGAMIWGSPSAPETPPPSPSPFSRPVEFAGSPAGSLGYLLHHLDSEICPPEASAWETVLLNRAVEEIADAVINQTITLATGLLEASMENTPRSLITRDVEGTCPLLPSQGAIDDPVRVALHLFRQVSTELGFVSIEKMEAQQWSSLLLLCPRELFEIIHKKDCDPEDHDHNFSQAPEDQSGRTSGENFSSNSSNPDAEEIISDSTPLLSQKPTN